METNGPSQSEKIAFRLRAERKLFGDEMNIWVLSWDNFDEQMCPTGQEKFKLSASWIVRLWLTDDCISALHSM